MIDGAMSVLTIRQSIMFHATVDDNIMDNAESFARAAISALRSRADSFTFLEWYAAPELINDAKIPVRVKAWLGSPSSSRVVTWRETQELPGCSGVVLRGVYGTSSLTNDCQLFLDDRRIVSPSSGSVPTLSNTVWRRPQDRSFVKNARESEEFLQVLLSQVYRIENKAISVSEGALTLFISNDLVEGRLRNPASCSWAAVSVCVEFLDSTSD